MGKRLGLRKSFPLRPGARSRSPIAGVDIADTIALIFKAAGEVKAHPAVVLALILVCRRATQRTARIDRQWLSWRRNESSEQHGRNCSCVPDLMDARNWFLESLSCA